MMYQNIETNAMLSTDHEDQLFYYRTCVLCGVVSKIKILYDPTHGGIKWMIDLEFVRRGVNTGGVFKGNVSFRCTETLFLCIKIQPTSLNI